VTGPEVRVTGIAELSRAFRKVDAELPKELKGAFRAIAEKVIGVAQAKMPSVSGRAKGSLKPRSTAKGAAIAFGGNAAAWEPWLDFGGTTGRGHKSQAGKGIGGGAIKRPIIAGGRYVFPAISESHDLIIHEVNEAVVAVAKKAGFETRGGD
jgi:hypothetical protein